MHTEKERKEERIDLRCRERTCFLAWLIIVAKLFAKMTLGCVNYVYDSRSSFRSIVPQ